MLVAASIAPKGGGGRQVVVAAAVTIAVALPARAPTPPRTPVIEIAGSSTLTRPPATIHVTAPGALVTVRAAPATALWLYQADRPIAWCPGPDCSAHGAALVLRFRPTARARYRVLAADGVVALVSSGDFDVDVLAARARGARLGLAVIEVILVAAPP